jgi:hypothetical protein
VTLTEVTLAEVTLEEMTLAESAWNAAPDHYELLLENQHVRVIRVHHEPYTATPMHEHERVPYLIVGVRGGELIGTDARGQEHAIAIVEGAVRYHETGTWTHAVRNASDRTIEALRIELRCLADQSSQVRRNSTVR